MPVLANVEPAKWILIITFISFLFNLTRSENGVTKARQNIGILGIFAFILASRLAATDTWMWWMAVQDFIRVSLVYFMFINLVNTEKRLRNFCVIFLLVNAVVAIRFYLAYKSGNATYWGSKPGDQSLGFLANADDLGIGLVIASAYALMPIVYAKKLAYKAFCAVISGCCALGILATDSRGALVGLFAVFIATIITQVRFRKFRKGHLAIGVLIVLLVFTGFVVRYNYAIHESFDSMKDEDDPGRVGREATWAAARAMIQSHPLTGVGRGNFVAYWQQNLPSGVYGAQVAHNIVYEVAAEIGVIGLVFFLYFSVYGLFELGRIKKLYKAEIEKLEFLDMAFAVYIVGLVGFVVNGMFITVAFYWHIYILVAMFVSAKNILMKEVNSTAEVSA